MDWGSDMRGFFSAKAYSWFLATECASRAAKGHASVKTCVEIARRFLFEGCPTPRSAAILAAFFALPSAWQKRARDLAAVKVRLHPARPRKRIAALFGMEL